MATGNDPIGILGGTFDPIHNGHLRSALEILERFRLLQVRFIPCHQPAHRERPTATPTQRLAMLEMALAGQEGFVVDDRELRRAGPSYMVESLESLRLQLGPTPLCLLLGVDAFNGLPGWHRWRELLDLTHLVVLHRPDSTLSTAAALEDLVLRHKLASPRGLRDRPAGGLVFQPVTQLAISATEIRRLLANQCSPRYLLPESVQAYINDQGLYRSPSTCC